MKSSIVVKIKNTETNQLSKINVDLKELFDYVLEFADEEIEDPEMALELF